MPQASIKVSSALGIRLDGDRTSFGPGDTITGCVVRASHIVSTHATVTVSLAGRVKTKVIAGATVYRGRTTLVDEQRHTQTVFQGPLHIPPAPTPDESERTWPFTMTIPTHVEADDGDGEQPQILPGTFTMERAGFGPQDEGFIAYTIKAELQATSQGSVDSTTAILPITILTVNPGPPMADSHLIRHRLYGCVSSYRLLPEVNRSGRSFSQKARSLFSSQKVPALAGHMEIDTPAVIQLEHPDPIPLRVRFVPDANVLRDSGILGVPQTIQLLSLSMNIRPSTEVACEGAPAPWSAPSTAAMTLSAWSRVVLGPGTPPLYIPYDDDEPPVDVGLRAGLRLGRGGLMSKSFAMGNIHPFFSTRFLTYTHRVSYELHARVAEEDIKHKWAVDVTILPPAGAERASSLQTTAGREGGETDEASPPPFDPTWDRPPPDGEAPPVVSHASSPPQEETGDKA